MSRKLWDHANSKLGISIRIATYNVENLFADGEEAKPRAARRALARMINLLDADFLMLQEVGSVEVLEQLNAELASPYGFVGLIPGNSTRSIHLGVLSRYVTDLTSHRETPLYDREGEILRVYTSESDALAGHKREARMQRDVLLARFRVGVVHVAVFGVHLKSFHTPLWMDLGTDVLREAEARCVTRLICDYRDDHPEDCVVLLGDFNDTASSDALAPIQQLDFIDPHKRWFQSLGRNPSTYWPRRRSRIDRIYLSPETADWVAEGSQTIHAGEMAKQASDHYPVSVVLDIPEQTESV